MAACLAVPPATQTAMGVGVRRVEPKTENDVPLQLRVGLHPMQVDRTRLRRRADFGVGYLLDKSLDGDRVVQGSYLEGSLVLFKTTGRTGANRGAASATEFFRLSSRAQARLLFDNKNDRAGRGAALQLAGEHLTWLQIRESTSDSEIYVRGETSLGYYVEGAWSSLGQERIWSAGAGLLFRLPATFVLTSRM